MVKITDKIKEILSEYKYNKEYNITYNITKVNNIPILIPSQPPVTPSFEEMWRRQYTGMTPHAIINRTKWQELFDIINNPDGLEDLSNDDAQTVRDVRRSLLDDSVW